MKTLKTLALVGALAAGSSAMATQITGSVQFGSTTTVTLSPTGPFTGVTSVDFADNVNSATVSSALGDFTAIVGKTASFQDFSTGSAVASLWSIVSPTGWKFDLDTSSNVSNPATPNFLSITGTGTVYGPGFDATPGTYTFQVTGDASDPEFSFTASTRSVPDGGATAMLLGVGLLGVGALRRKVS